MLTSLLEDNLSNFFDKLQSFFRNGKKYPPIIKEEDKKVVNSNIAEWEEDEKIDNSIMTEITSDIRSLIESFRVMNFNLIILNSEFRIVFASDLFLKLTDFTSDNLLGKELRLIIPEPFTEKERLDLLSEIGAISTSKRIILFTGENIPVQLYIQTVKGLDELCYTVIVVPMGGRKSF
jgi:PAS domain-containing protein